MCRLLPAVRRAPVVLALIFAAPAAPAAPPAPVLGHPARYVIVTTEALAPGFAALVEWKIKKGVPAAIRTLETIRSDHPAAADDAERVRLALRDAHQAGARWALIGGDTDVIPIRYASTTFYTGPDIPTDLYYGALAGDWNADGDARYGEAADAADLTAELAVGRAPVRTVAEAARVAARIVEYERFPAGDGENSRLLAAEVLFPDSWSPGVPITFDGAETVEPLLPVFDGRLQPVTRLYENFGDPRWRPGAHPLSAAALRDSLSRGYGLVALVGHGSPSRFSAGDGHLTAADLLALANAGRPFAAYFQSSGVCRPDSESLGEAMLRAPLGGAAAVIGQAEAGFVAQERAFFERFVRVSHDSGVTRIGAALARTRDAFAPMAVFDGVMRWTLMHLTLLGDPELTLWLERPRPLELQHPATAAPGQPITITVSSGGLPLAGARVTLHQPGVYLALLVTGVDGTATVTPSGAAEGPIAITASADGHRPDEGTLLFGAPTATAAALTGWRFDGAGLELTWHAPGWVAAATGLEHHDAAGDRWERRGTVRAGAPGVLVARDEPVAPGRRRYRLATAGADGPRHSAAAEVEVPVAILAPAIESVTPHPAGAGARVTLLLAGAAGARLELLDVAGRRVWRREVVGPGRRVVELEAPPPPGRYVLRLCEGAAVRRRDVVIR